ncbi:carbohydrate ABC transporter permease [Promicromonospora iranensis]|uniref:Multiple sugar transport system permease protein n=1 Tax=Promicromonospora iranensis TaxID=1105144 RepID=A0ABU2CLW0_9MICO|nr:carbohydrate ABC transporter permease [Promicromonospora iranensis]MDR7382330.1 multiple sugar transport system permease protein [Promicromonospora iranensis]
MTNTLSPPTGREAPPAATRPRRRRRRGGLDGHDRLTRAVLLLGTCLLVMVPFAWMISLAFTPPEQAFGSVALVPEDPTLENFSTALLDADLLRALANSAIVAAVVVLGNCVIAILAGYAFAMLPFRGSTAVFFSLVATTAIPVSVTLIPLFLMTRGVPLAGGNDILGQGGSGLLDTLAGLTLPHLVMPMNIFLARQYFSGSSRDLAEAARIDGAGEWRIFSRIYLPLAKPLVAVIAIFSFTGVWDDFLWPLVITSSPESQTVQLALARFLVDGNVQYGPLMAGVVLVTLPVIAVFLFNQRGFISGLTDGSVKG